MTAHRFGRVGSRTQERPPLLLLESLETDDDHAPPCPDPRRTNSSRRRGPAQVGWRPAIPTAKSPVRWSPFQGDTRRGCVRRRSTDKTPSAASRPCYSEILSGR